MRVRAERPASVAGKRLSGPLSDATRNVAKSERDMLILAGHASERAEFRHANCGSLSSSRHRLVQREAAMRLTNTPQFEGPRCESLAAAIGMTVGCVLGGLLGRAAAVAHLTEPGLGTTLIVLTFAFAGAMIGQALCHYRARTLAIR
jgi:hypothetical protein